MKYSKAEKGRTFVVRLEDGDFIHEELEAMAQKEELIAASLIAVGAIDKGSILVCGPHEGRAKKITPVEINIEDVYEATGTGTIFIDDEEQPKVHMHLSCGRDKEVLTGCIQKGVRVWHVMEVIVQEITNCSAIRKKDPHTGFKLLEP